MSDMDYGAYQGKPVTDEFIQELSAACERDWEPDKISVRLTDYGRTVRALQEIGLPVYEITALERRADQARVPFSKFVRALFEKELSA